MTLVGMYADTSLPLVSMIGRPVIEPPPRSSDELGAALEQPGVQVEDVARVGLAARRAAQQQRDGTVGLGLLGQVVEDDQDVLALVHPVLADGRAGVGREVLEAGRVGRGGGDDGRVLQRAGLLEGPAHRGDGRALLADRHVDAFDLLLGSPDAQLSRWLMIASTATAVLPVCRSPMISWRWPRPIAVIASMALMPVCSGSFTGWRCTTDGACSSSARRPSVTISPLPSIGRPSASTTRPR